jgi:hypothetical protein
LKINQESQAKLDRMFRVATVFTNCLVKEINRRLGAYTSSLAYTQWRELSQQYHAIKVSSTKVD